jgi:predicted alpha-1,6-mannanase (GH76 family)
MKQTLTACLMLFLLCISCQSPKSEEQINYQPQVEKGMKVLLDARNPISGWWEKAGWWNSANLLTCVVRYAELSKDTSLHAVIDDIFEKSKTVHQVASDKNTPVISTHYINDFYDDEAWWALAWIEAYKVTGKQKYLDMAESIFKDLTTGWSDLFGGGSFWKKNPLQYKNAIANNLFGLTAARLYKETQKENYLEWLTQEIEWMSTTGMINADTYYVEDGLKDDGTPNRGQHYTYNQGVALAVLTEAFNITGNPAYLLTAESIADATIDKGPFTTENGILKERNKNIAASNDGVQFKGVFIRHLAFLNSVSPKASYKDFILDNAAANLKLNFDKEEHRFGCYWYGPYVAYNIAAHSCGMECLLEAWALTR